MQTSNIEGRSTQNASSDKLPSNKTVAMPTCYRKNKSSQHLPRLRGLLIGPLFCDIDEPAC